MTPVSLPRLIELARAATYDRKPVESIEALLRFQAEANPATVIALAEALREVVGALEFYVNTAGKTMKVNGPIIEFDPDAGPLRDVYEVPASDDGTTARSAIARIAERVTI